MAKSRRRKRRRRAPGRHGAPQAPAGPAAAKAETRSGNRSAAARRAAAREERPPAPWGSFPLVEIAVLVGLIMLVVGFIRQDALTVGVGIVLGSLAGLELSVREHFAGYRSHTVLLAGTAFVITVAALFYVAGLILLVCLAAGAAVFAATFLALRAAFRRASGGLSFKAGGLRG